MNQYMYLAVEAARKPYTSDLTEAQWAIINPFLPVHTSGRPRTTNMREVLNAIFYFPNLGYKNPRLQAIFLFRSVLSAFG